ncbi:MFS transporter [Brevibacterium sp. 50QC2O2]|uniref:MFS transporter n=1 Tax=Brevibacterium sp. 50QC2O2 TaxID=2968459 RepID=UPI00211C46E5|nr:MFS transporter [Brevibacterium sp. 50QC2O2]MCQ9389891.1 MFS transporter [Brevibacterium sp. 50QC2O2]
MSAQTAAQNPEAPTGKQLKPWKIILASCVGNALEWYDIAIYAYFSVYLSKAFFPSDNEFVSLLLTLTTFALSFFIRPIGALVLGSYADRHGRKPGLTMTITLMFIGTLIFVVTPPAHMIGLAAPLLIIVARLIQGFAAGGEFGAATALMMEHLPDKKAFAASWQFASQAVSTIVAALIGVFLTTSLSAEALESWGFRLPFLIGLLVGPAGLIIRRHVPESPEFDKNRAPESGWQAVKEVFAHQKLRMLIAMGVLAVSTCLNYIITFIPTFAVKNLGLGPETGFIAALAGGIVLFIFSPTAGILADRTNRFLMMVPAGLAILLCVYGIFAWVQAVPLLIVLVILVSVLSLFKAFYYGPMASVMADIFPAETRGTGLAFSYNLGVAIFGGLTPTIALWLTQVTGEAKSPSYWVMFSAALSLVSLAACWKKYGIK